MPRNLREEIEILTKELKKIASIYSFAAKQSGMSESEFCIFYSLIVMGDNVQKDICNMWSLPKQTVNSVIASLQRRDYIELENEEGSKNRKIIKLTDIGREYGEKVVNKIFEAEKQALKMMTEEEIKTCIELTQKYEENLRNCICK